MSREMKDSGVAWIGEIPKGWGLEKAKLLFKQSTSRGNERLVLLSATQDRGVINKSELDGVVQVSANADLNLFKTVHVNDFVISLRSFQGGFELSKEEGVISPAYTVFRMLYQLYPHYYRYLFKSIGFIDKINSLTVGIREGKNIQYKDFANMIIPQIDEIEQQTIANYLDEKCAEIDNLISLLEEMIGELKAYKQSVITEAVCKGLNKNAPMKESGIEWIGEIPRDWGICRLKNHIIFNPKHKNEKGLCNDDIVSFMPMECLRTGNIEPKSTTYQIAQAYTPFENDDIVMAKVTPCFENGNIAIAYDLLNGYGFGSSELFVFRCNNELSNTFLYYYLQSNFAKAIGVSSMTGTGGLKRVNPTTLNNIQLLFPPLSEQQTIANYLDEKCGNIEGLIAIKQAKIDELKEFKKSLIYEYVTGKKSVI